jgi:hypothetical protein
MVCSAAAGVRPVDNSGSGFGSLPREVVRSAEQAKHILFRVREWYGHQAPFRRSSCLSIAQIFVNLVGVVRS